MLSHSKPPFAGSQTDNIISKGVKKGRLRAVGYGDSRPLLPGEKYRHAINRRVSFWILKRR